MNAMILDRDAEARLCDERVKAWVAGQRRDHVALAYTLAYMEDHELHTCLEFADLPSYAVAREAAVSRSQARELVLFVRRLERLPVHAAAFAQGTGWTKLRETSRAATPETDGCWVELARTESYRTCRREAAKARGLPLPEDGRRRLTPVKDGWFSVALRAARKQVDATLTDSQVLELICESWLRADGRLRVGASGADVTAWRTDEPVTRVTVASTPVTGTPPVTDEPSTPVTHVASEVAGAAAAERPAADARVTLMVGTAPVTDEPSTPVTPAAAERTVTRVASISHQSLADRPVTAQPLDPSSTLFESLRRLTAG